MKFVIAFDSAYAEKPGLDEAAKVVWPAESGNPEIPLARARVYAAKRRITALMDQVGEDAVERSIYGTIEGNIVTRAEERFVEDFLVVKDALKEMGVVDKIWLNPDRLRLDKRALLGLDSKGVNTTFEGVDWSCPVLGSLELKACAEGLTLRPDRIDHQTSATERTLTFVEGVELPIVDGPPELKVVFERPAESLPRWRTESLSSKGALLFDVMQDGGWESSSPLWVKTTEGCLRVERKETKVRYGVLNESRSVDVTEWFYDRTDGPERSLLPPGGRVHLLLDHCGCIKVDVKSDSEKLSASLTIQSPAFVILLQGVSPNPLNMVDSSQPPSVSMFSAGPLLHVVSAPLFQTHAAQSADVLQWDISTDGDGYLQLSTDRGGKENDASFRYYCPDSDWVRPPEAVANAENSEMSAMRVLLPHAPRPDVRTVLTLKERGLVLGGFSAPGAEIELLLDTPSAVALGPLAKFTVGKGGIDDLVSLDKELSVEGEIEPFSEQPAVLRPGYRGLPDAQGVLASFAATYVYDGTKPLKEQSEVRRAYKKGMADETTTWALRAKDGEAEIRRDDFSKTGLARFGWWNSHRFIRRQLAGAGAWLELKKPMTDQNKWQLTHWLRLSDASLARLNDSVELAGLADADLEAKIADGPIKLESPLSTEEAHGLGHMVLVETYDVVSTFSLWLDGVEVPVAKPDFTVVGRLVIAWATPIPPTPMAAISLADDVTVNRLNRLFLELEREGSEFRVRRGMLGWNAAQVFGLDCSKDENGAPHDFHFTEYYERSEGELSRRVDLSGVALGPKISTSAGVLNKVSGVYQPTVYFWASVLLDDPEPRYVRVICAHKMTCAGVSLKSAWAVQDARVMNKRLDLSADIALVEATGDPEGDPQSALDVWQPWRRKLFSVNINPIAERVSTVFFLQIRQGPVALFEITRDTVRERAFTLHYDWERCNTAITPWFSDESISRRDQTTWLTPQTSASQPTRDLLRTVGPGAVDGLNMVVRLFDLRTNSEVVFTSNLRACTLVGEVIRRTGEAVGPSEPKEGIPQWVPSPILDADASAPAAGPIAEPANQVSVWLFDPWPRVVVQFEGTADAALSRTRARSALARIGWTREAVLELSIAGVPTWSVVDSPLLNRDADINWFGWPLVGGAQRPKQGPLPRTAQVVHVPDTSRPRVGVHVTFRHEVDADGNFRLPMVYLPRMPTAPSSAIRFHDVLFRSRGLRTGVPHQVVTYGTNVNAGPSFKMVDPSSISADGAPVPDLKSVVDADGGGMEFSWGSGSGDLADVQLLDVKKLDERVRLVLGPILFWSRVIFLAMPAGLQVRVGPGDDAAWKDIVKGIPIDMIAKPETERVVDVRLPSGLWSAIHLVLQMTEAAADGPTVSESLTRSYFVNPSGAQSVAGLFRNGQLVAFGDEPMRFSPTLNEGIWSYRSITTMQGFSPTDKVHVASMNPFGVITRHVE